MKFTAFPVKIKKRYNGGLDIYLNTGHLWHLHQSLSNFQVFVEALNAEGLKPPTSNYRDLKRWLLNVRPPLTFKYEFRKRYSYFGYYVCDDYYNLELIYKGKE